MKRVLLAVCGLSPQVITETLYVLYQQSRMVDAVRILTTTIGKEKCLAQLLSPKDGQFYQFLEQYGIPENSVDFHPRNIISVTDDNGRQIEDITIEEESALFLEKCMEQAFHLTRDPDNEVYFSIAGGRKTMGSCLSLAAQFYARRQDRIFHVLVSPPEFENSREFFFPPKLPRYVRLFDKSSRELYMKTDNARLTLVAMPFVSIRQRLKTGMLKEPESPASLLMSLIREDEPILTIDLNSKKVVWKGLEMDMPPARLAIYVFFAMVKKKAQCDKKSCRDCQECALSYDQIAEDYTEEIAEIYDRTATRRREEPEKRGIRFLEREALTQYKSKINADLLKNFGPYESKKLNIKSFGQRNNTFYFLPLDRKRIRLII